MTNWLDYQVPFVNGQLPVSGGNQAPGELPDVGDNLYVRIDQEIRDLTDPQRGGYAEDNWESRISTTLLYLESESELPFYNQHGQLPAEKGMVQAEADHRGAMTMTMTMHGWVLHPDAQAGLSIVAQASHWSCT